MNVPTWRCSVRPPLALCCAAVLGVTAVIAPWAIAQDVANTSLIVGSVRRATLETGVSQSYTIEVDSGFFISGAANQISVDVVVKIFDPAGLRLAEFDVLARGRELFQFETTAAGQYRIEVAPFETETGDYEIELRRAEPIATAPGDRVDQLMSPYDDPMVPGGVVAVVVDGEIVFGRSYGAANLTHGIPFEVDTRTNIGSTSKQFTAYAIMLLAEQGKLGIDDDVRTHISELPDLGETVTIRHLLN